MVLDPHLARPMRRAQEQFQIAGADTCLVLLDSENGLVYVDGAGGEAVMVRAEWEAYKRLCQAAEDPFEAAADEAGLHLPLERGDILNIVASLRQEAGQILNLVNSAATTLSVEDYNDALQGAAQRLGVMMNCLRKLESRLALEIAQAEQSQARGATHLLMMRAPLPSPAPTPTSTPTEPTGGDVA